MCNKFRFIADIENKKISDYMHYCARLRRIYMIFGIIAIINIASTFRKEDHVIRLLQILGIIIYAALISCFQIMSDMASSDHRLRNIVISVISLLVINTANNLAMFTYIVIKYYSWTVFFSLISLFLQITTWYIFYYFLITIDKEASKVEEPVSAYAVAHPVVTPMSQATPIADKV